MSALALTRRGFLQAFGATSLAVSVPVSVFAPTAASRIATMSSPLLHVRRGDAFAAVCRILSMDISMDGPASVLELGCSVPGRLGGLLDECFTRGAAEKWKLSLNDEYEVYFGALLQCLVYSFDVTNVPSEAWCSIGMDVSAESVAFKIGDER